MEAVRLALEATGRSDDVREILVAMLDEAERELLTVAQLAQIPPLDPLSVLPAADASQGIPEGKPPSVA